MQIIILEKSRLFHLGYLFGGMLTLYICSRGAESATLVGRGGEKLGEGRAGAPGDQALLQRDLGLLQKGPPSEMEGG